MLGGRGRLPGPCFPATCFSRKCREARRSERPAARLGSFCLLGDAKAAYTVPVGVIASIRARQNRDGLVELGVSHFRKGQKVRIVSGALSRFEAIFDVADDRQRVQVLMELFGEMRHVVVVPDILEAAI